MVCVSHLHSRIVVAFLGLACGLLPGCGRIDAPAALEIGQPAPEFELPALDGGTVSSRSYLGQPLIVNFWATWCGPCLHEIPVLQEIERTAGVAVVAIALDEDGEAVVRPFVEKHRMEYTVLLGDPETFARYGGWAIPYTLLLDAAHNVVAIHRGLVSERTLERDLHRIGA